jgi:hypothetical protein
MPTDEQCHFLCHLLYPKLIPCEVVFMVYYTHERLAEHNKEDV